MDYEIKELKNKAGQVCFGEDEFFMRYDVIDDFWNKIENGNDLLFVAPRRVGKTSIMRYIESNPKEGYIVIFDDVESICNANMFFERLYYLLIKELSTKEKIIKTGVGFFRDIISSIDSVSLLEGSLKFKESSKSNTEDYFSKLIKMVSNIKLKDTIIFMVDEIPYVLKRIWDNEGTDEAIAFLAQNRELRQKSSINDIRFVYAGSIGFRNIVEQLGTQETQHINNFIDLLIPPLSDKEAVILLKSLSKGAKLNFDDDAIRYLINKIGLNMPFYLQLAFSKINELVLKGESVVTRDTVDKAIKQLLKDHARFSYWKERLNDVLKNDEERIFAKTVLTKLCKEKSLSFEDLVLLAETTELEMEKVRFILNLLEHDGYIVENDGTYSFQSPILKQWWYDYVAD